MIFRGLVNNINDLLQIAVHIEKIKVFLIINQRITPKVEK